MLTTHTIWNAECLTFLRSLPTDSVDLVLTSPPYEDARSLSSKETRRLNEHGFIDGEFRLSGDAWVNWLHPIVVECCRVSRGLVCLVVEGRTKNYSYSATPLLLASRLASQAHRHLNYDLSEKQYEDLDNGQHRGQISKLLVENFPIYLRKPLIYQRYGIPGSGGPDYLRNDYEFVIVCSKYRRLVWSDNTAMGSPPKFGPGGDPSHRTQDGSRVNAAPLVDGKRRNAGGRVGGTDLNVRDRGKDGEVSRTRQQYIPPKIANPGNIIYCGAAGGGNIGDEYAHDNEAPFPEKLAEFIIRTFCPPCSWKPRSSIARLPRPLDRYRSGTVLDPFAGSGTTLKVALTTGRNSIGCDIRRGQYNLIRKRLRAAGATEIRQMKTGFVSSLLTFPSKKDID